MSRQRLNDRRHARGILLQRPQDLLELRIGEARQLPGFLKCPELLLDLTEPQKHPVDRRGVAGHQPVDRLEMRGHEHARRPRGLSTLAKQAAQRCRSLPELLGKCVLCGSCGTGDTGRRGRCGLPGLDEQGILTDNSVQPTQRRCRRREQGERIDGLLRAAKRCQLDVIENPVPCRDVVLLVLIDHLAAKSQCSASRGSAVPPHPVVGCKPLHQVRNQFRRNVGKHRLGEETGNRLREARASPAQHLLGAEAGRQIEVNLSRRVLAILAFQPRIDQLGNRRLLDRAPGLRDERFFHGDRRQRVSVFQQALEMPGQ